MKRIPTIGSAVIDRLHQLGVRHVFRIPGDYVLNLYQLIEESPIQHVGTTREDCAGFAADAYARINGIGAACVTYCVGGLNTVNAIACAYAERSPVVLLSGSPGLSQRPRNPLRLVEHMNVPVASTLLGKSVIREDHPLSIGVYSGLFGRDEVQRFVHDADCLLMLGSILTDFDLGASPAVLSERHTIHATAD